MSRRDELALRDYLEYIQQAITRIQRYLQDIDHAGFLANEEKQDAVIRNFEIIGEAAGNIQRHFPDFATKHPDFPSRRLTARETPWHMGTSRSIWMWFGGVSREICLTWKYRLGRQFNP